MPMVKSENNIDMIEEFESTKENARLGNKRSKNDLNIQMTKTLDFNRSISLQSSKKRDQKGCHFQITNHIFAYLRPFNLLTNFMINNFIKIQPSCDLYKLA